MEVLIPSRDFDACRDDVTEIEQRTDKALNRS